MKKIKLLDKMKKRGVKERKEEKWRTISVDISKAIKNLDEMNENKKMTAKKKREVKK